MPGFERKALRVAAFACSVAATALSASAILGRIGEEGKAIDDYRERIARLSKVIADEGEARLRLREIEGKIGRLEERKAAEANTAASAFGREAIALLAAKGILPAKYKLLAEEGKKELEVDFTCDTLELFRFLREATDEAKGWAIPYASIQAADGRFEVGLRLSL